MKSTYYSISSAACAVSGLHALLLAMLWQPSPKPIHLTEPSLVYVQLSDIQPQSSTANPSVPTASLRTPIQPPRPKPTPTTPKLTLPTTAVAKPTHTQPKHIAQAHKPNTPNTHSTNTIPSQPATTNTSIQGAGKDQGITQNNSNNSDNTSIIPPTHLGNHLGNQPPPYPPLSRDNGEQGSVGMRVYVSADGRAEKVEVIKSSRHPRLDKAASKAVAAYRFTPATQGGHAIAYRYTFTIHFKLKQP